MEHTFKVGDLVHGRKFNIHQERLTRGVVKGLDGTRRLYVAWIGREADLWHYSWLTHLSPLKQLAEVAE